MVFVCSNVQAGSFTGFELQQTSIIQSYSSWGGFLDWLADLFSHVHSHGCGHNGADDGAISSVPELDAAGAPLGVLLLGAIVVAGAERRKRVSK